MVIVVGVVVGEVVLLLCVFFRFLVVIVICNCGFGGVCGFVCV